MALPKAEFEAVRRTKVYEQVAQQLQRMIRDGLVKPGEKLPPERELAEMLQVSRGSLRDAIRTLELMGLVEPRQGEGTVVCDPSAEVLDQSAGYRASAAARTRRRSARISPHDRAHARRGAPREMLPPKNSPTWKIFCAGKKRRWTAASWPSTKIRSSTTP